MVTIVKSEWHSVEKRYALVITEDDLTQIYPDHDETEIASMMEEIMSGDFDYQQLVEDSNNADAKVYLDFEWLDEDDWWTDRKGGYDVTFEVQADE
jgi:hypothetical protein